VKEFIEDKYIPVSCGGTCTFEHSKMLIDSMPEVLPTPQSVFSTSTTTGIAGSGGEVMLEGGEKEGGGETDYEDGDENFKCDVQI